MDYVKYADDAAWEPHPSGIDGIEIKKLRSRADGHLRESICFVRVRPGVSVPPHVHAGEDDNLYIISGAATMRVLDDRFPIGPGAQVTVPAGAEHEIYDVSEELLIYDVFAPPTF